MSVGAPIVTLDPEGSSSRLFSKVKLDKEESQPPITNLDRNVESGTMWIWDWMLGELGENAFNDCTVDSDRMIGKSTAADWMAENSEENASQKVKDISCTNRKYNRKEEDSNTYSKNHPDKKLWIIERRPPIDG